MISAFYFARRIKRNIENNRLNSKAKKLHCKRLILESDDWGSIRTPDRATYETLRDQGDRISSNAFLKYDCLEGEEDIGALYKILEKHVDRNGRAAVVTMNFAVANPNFERIRNSHFSAYFFEDIKDTYKKYRPNHDVIGMIRTGIQKGFVRPQLHCREHLNVVRWMNDLKAGNETTRKAFRYGMVGIGDTFSAENPYGYMDAFNYCSADELAFELRALEEAVQKFEELFGYPTKTFAPCCYVWGDELERVLAANHISMIQGYRYQYKPSGDSYVVKAKVPHRFGELKPGITYSVRNCSFEPAYRYEKGIEKCMDEIDSAFRYGAPAIINTHRMNYMGGIMPENRTNGLKQLDLLLGMVQDKHPDVQFMSSDELAELLRSELE